jgi:hypothetical protein
MIAYDFEHHTKQQDIQYGVFRHSMRALSLTALGFFQVFDMYVHSSNAL